MEYNKILNLNVDEVLDIEEINDYTSYPIESDGGEFFIFPKDKGICFTFTHDKLLKQIDFFSEGYLGCGKFNAQLPLGLSFSFSLEQVDSLLGKPAERNEAKKVPMLGDFPAFDKYLFENYELHIRYNKAKDSLLLVTLSLKNKG